MELKIGQLVLSVEHPNGVGEVTRINEKGDATIRFTTPPSKRLPFGHVADEFWPVADQRFLTNVTKESA